jgi:hypothetical protein
MFRITLPVSARSFTAVAVAAVVSIAVPGLATAQGWDWDEDFKGDFQGTTVMCSTDGESLEQWANDLLDGAPSVDDDAACSEAMTWS